MVNHHYTTTLSSFSSFLIEYVWFFVNIEDYKSFVLPKIIFKGILFSFCPVMFQHLASVLREISSLVLRAIPPMTLIYQHTQCQTPVSMSSSSYLLTLDSWPPSEPSISAPTLYWLLILTVIYLSFQQLHLWPILHLLRFNLFFYHLSIESLWEMSLSFSQFSAQFL